MMPRLSPATALLCALVGLGRPAAAQERTWTAPPARAQVAQDPTVVPAGKGLLFVPVMTTSRNEPSYQVLRDGQQVAAANPGTGVLLAPGTYQVLIGSGNARQMMRKTVRIAEGKVSLVRPTWAALVINVIDESRTSIQGTYELFDQDDQENYGVGYGIEEERGEEVKTWLLPPGDYAVVKVGDNVATTRKFSVRLEPGQLVQRNLVVKEEAFVGFYLPSVRLGPTLVSKRFKTQWILSGSPQMSRSRNTPQDQTSIAVSVQAYNNTTYASRRHYANLRFIGEEGASRVTGASFRKTTDKVEVRATYIRRLSRRVGPYLRGVLNTKAFATDVYFDAPRDFARLGVAGDTVAVLRGARHVRLEPPLYPLQLREGVGINSQVYRSFPFNMDLRFGWGARQTYVSDSYATNGDARTATSATRLVKARSTGFEALMVTDARVTRFVTLDSEFDILMPSRQTATWEFAWENRWRVLLTSFANLDLVIDLNRPPASQRRRDAEGRETRLLGVKGLEMQQQVLLRLSYVL